MTAAPPHLYASHFGVFEVVPGPRLTRFRQDRGTPRLGLAELDLAHSPTRILQPMARRGWLAGDQGAARGDDVFVPLSLDEAAARAARELQRVRDTYGNRAIFGGSYGWASAGRFHHAQSQLKRFLNLAGGFVASRNTYSFGTAKVLLRHVLGAEHADSGVFAPSWDTIVNHCGLIVAFGGLRLSNTEVESGATADHRVAQWIGAYRRAGGRMITLSPDARDAPMGDHIPITPGTDTAVLLALCHELKRLNRIDQGFLDRCCVGAAAFLDSLSDAANSPEAAAQISGVPAATIRSLATQLADTPSLINLAWSLQRARFGEQPYQAAVALAACLGRIGQPGQGLALGLGAVNSVGQPVRQMRAPALSQGRNPVSEYIPVARITDMLERPGTVMPYDTGSLTLPDIRLIWWAGGNPFHHHQDLNRLRTAWRRPETVIVHDPVWTATARHADLVFPAAFGFERDDIAGASRENWLVHSRRVMDPPPGVETDHHTLARVARVLGVEDAFTEGRNVDDWLRALYAGYRAAFPELPDWDGFVAAGAVALDPGQQAPAPYVPLAAFVRDPKAAPLGTASGKIELASDPIRQARLPDCPSLPTWRDPDDDEDPSLPLRLLSPQPETRLHSQLDGASPARTARPAGFEVARLHPDDLALDGMPEGGLAELYNARGITIVHAIPDPDVKPGTAVLPTGGWYDPIHDALGRLVDLGGNPNTLSSDKGSSGLSQGASANHPRVGLRPLQDPGLRHATRAHSMPPRIAEPMSTR